MSERGRVLRAPPKLSSGLKTSTSASQEPKAHASEGARAESSHGAAQAKPSASESPRKSDESIRSAQEALSALQIDLPSRATIHPSGNVTTGASEQGASMATGPSRQERSPRQRGTGTSSGFRVPRPLPNESSGTLPVDPTAKERRPSPAGLGSPHRAVQAAGPSSSRALRDVLGGVPAPRAIEAAGSSSSRKLNQALGQEATPRGVEARDPSSRPILRGTMGRGSAPCAIEKAASSSSRTSSEASRRGAASASASSSDRLGQATEATHSATVDTTTAIYNESGSTSQVSLVRPMALNYFAFHLRRPVTEPNC